MQRFRIRLLTCLVLGFVALALLFAARNPLRLPMRHEPSPSQPETNQAGTYPSDWFGAQRAFPANHIPQEKFLAAVEQANFDRALEAAKPTSALLEWSNQGPFNVGGRVTALAAVPGGVTAYLASANGGVFKSTNSGVNWTPIFDTQAVFSIGALALVPGTSGVLYVGTGESNASVDSYDGAGLFRTQDGGGSWEFLGLEATRRIARVVVDPKNANRIFVAAMGTQFSTNPDRGLYLSENAGSSWSKVLFVNDSTGVCDVVINPAHSDTVYAASWERIRRPSYRRAYGPGCGIWRSLDFGHTWTRLTSGLPVPSDNVGRIGLAIAPSRPRTLYAQIGSGAALGYVGLGMYRSTNGGDTWTRRDTGTGFTGMFGGFCWYFGDCAVDPTNPDRVYALGLSFKRSNDGGVNYSALTGNAHVDFHAIWIDPLNANRIYLGNDGGFYSTTTGASPYFKSVDLPITQFYACAVDPNTPGRFMGGTQDNNTLLTSSGPSAWTAVLGGDGFQCAFHPLNPSVLFAEYQFCCSGTGPQRSEDGGGFFTTPFGFDSADRYNWSTPILLNRSNPDVILVGSQRVYRSADNGVSYAPISGDLTTNPPASLVYGTITTLDISVPAQNVYYAGTDDGQVWRSTNTGTTWENISAGLPLRWVTHVAADRFDPQGVYVTLSGFGIDEDLAHVYRSTNRGTTWTSVAGNLPDVPANDLLPDPTDAYTLFLATDVGVYATRNRGASWFPLGTGMPVQTIFDLALHEPARKLVAGTHGRGMWTIDLAGLPSDVEASLPGELRLAPPVPNPSRGQVALRLELPRDGETEIAVYDAGGRRIRTLKAGRLARGIHPLGWDGRDARGVRVAAGVYFVRAAAAGATRVQRVVRAD